MIKTTRQPMRFDLVRGDITDFSDDTGTIVSGKVMLTMRSRVVIQNAGGIYVVPMMSRADVSALVAELRAY